MQNNNNNNNKLSPNDIRVSNVIVGTESENIQKYRLELLLMVSRYVNMLAVGVGNKLGVKL